jgi:tetratricopeptide (TPR) repeat protein/predicted Ser/Thr protein kinase
MNDNIVRCGSCGNVVSSDILTEEFSGACPWCLAGLSLPEGTGRRPTDVEALSPRSGPLPCDEPVAELPPEAREAPETARFGRFIRVSLLGAGGMGEVWKAWDPALGRWVALKFLKMKDARDLAWFQREAHVAATLSHPNIAAIHDIGEDQGLHYIAMQFVEGRNLEKMGRVEPRRTAELLRDAARAVAVAHEQRIIHRDLKPANLMVTEAGHMYVMDFGLARRIDSPSPYSLPGEAAGTPVYMSPAQAKGEALDARADVYSLGATLYEVLAGKPPIEGVTIHELLKKAQESSIRPLGEVAPAVPPELVSIAMKCLARDPDARYATARELADDLDNWLEGRPVAAHSAGVAYRARKFAARQAIAVVAIAAALFIALAVGAGYLRESRRDGAYVEAMARGQSAWEEVVRYTSGASAPELASKKAADARAHFESALASRDRAQAHLMRGRCLQLEGKLEEAVSAWQAAQKLDPAQEDAKFEEAKAVILKYQTKRGKPKAQVGRSANDPGGGTKVTVLKDPRPETPEQKELREKAEKLLAGYAGKEHQSALLKGMLAVSTYEFEKGAELLAQYTKQEPWDAQAMRLEATAWYYINRPKEALAAINRALERTQDARSYWLLGEIRIGADDDEGAIVAYTKAIELDPKEPEFYLERCYPNWRTGHYKEIEADATRAIELEPKKVAGYHSRSMARQVLGNHEGSYADVEKVIELEPSKPAGYTLRAHARMRKKDYEGAIADFTKSMELAADNKMAYQNALEWRVRAWRGKWVALRDAGRPEQAQEALREAIADQRKVLESNPKSVYDKTELSQLLRESGDAAAADTELAEAVKLNKQVAANWFDQQAQRLYVDKKWPTSLEFRRRALDIDPLRPGQRPIYVWLTRGWLKETDAATAELAAILDEKKLPMEDWDARIAGFLAGRVSEEDFLKSAETADEKATKGRRCEAYCFAAERRQILGNVEGAKDFYRRCLEQKQKNFLETYLAEKRLEEIEKK